MVTVSCIFVIVAVFGFAAVLGTASVACPKNVALSCGSASSVWPFFFTIGSFLAQLVSH